jgi:hypothetical protein
VLERPNAGLSLPATTQASGAPCEGEDHAAVARIHVQPEAVLRVGLVSHRGREDGVGGWVGQAARLQGER